MTRWLASTLVTLGCAGAILVGAEPAAAHDDTSGAIALTVTDRRVLGTAQVAFTELGYRDTSGDGLVDADELRAQEATVATSLVQRPPRPRGTRGRRPGGRHHRRRAGPGR